MTEIAAAAVPLLDSGAEARPEFESINSMIESALKAEIGARRFLDIWRDGTAEARCELLADLLYSHPAIAASVVETVLAGRYPILLEQIAQRIHDPDASTALDLYRQLPEQDLMQALLLSPERVLMFAEVLSVPMPLSTAERVLWAAAHCANAPDAAKLRYLMSRLARLKEQLDLVGRTLEHAPDAAARRGYANYRETVDREVERTEASMRRLEQMLAGLRTGAVKPARAPRRAFRLNCSHRERA